MRKEKRAALLCTAVLAVSLLAGCGIKNSTGEKETNMKVTDQVAGTYTVKVTAIEGNQVRAQIGELTKGEMAGPPEQLEGADEVGTGQNPLERGMPEDVGDSQPSAEPKGGFGRFIMDLDRRYLHYGI